MDSCFGPARRDGGRRVRRFSKFREFRFDGIEKIVMQSQKFVSTAELASRTGVSRITAWRTCVSNPGFAVRVGGTFRIPEAHVQRVEGGDAPAAIAAEARARAIRAESLLGSPNLLDHYGAQDEKKP
jgi:hypothetical protein